MGAFVDIAELSETVGIGIVRVAPNPGKSPTLLGRMHLPRIARVTDAISGAVLCLQCSSFSDVRLSTSGVAYRFDWQPKPGNEPALDGQLAGRRCDIADFGATLASVNNTAAIMAALSACAGGGTVVVQGGSFKTGPLVVTGRGVVLHIGTGASLEAAFGPADWPLLLASAGPAANDMTERQPCSHPPCTGQYQECVLCTWTPLV